MQKNRLALNFVATIGLLLATSACSTSHSQPDSSPGWENANDSGDSTGHELETVVILGTNDIHGALTPQKTKTKEPEGQAPTSYLKGGAGYLGSQIKILRHQFGDRLIWLDAGDEFQGTIESNLDEGATMVRFFNALGLSAAAVGNHEFDFGPRGPDKNLGHDGADPLGNLKARMIEAKYPYVASNIISRAGGASPFPLAKSHAILNAGHLKVGVIGLTTLDTPGATRPQFVKDLEFTDLKEATLREAAALRAEGAQVILVTAHVGLECELGKAPASAALRKPTDPQGDCDDTAELVRYLNSLPRGTVDAVVSGHSHRVIHHWVAGVPVIQTGTRNVFENLIYLTYDHTSGKVLPERTRIEGPIPVCPLVFAHQGDCNGDRPAPKSGRGELVTPHLHGKNVVDDSEVKTLLAPTLAQVDTAKKRVVGQAARAIPHSHDQESAMGNLIADSFRAKTHADVAIVNSGGIRAPFESGPITYEDVFRTLPFDNSVLVLSLSGKELKLMLQIAESGSRGFFPVSGIRLRLIDPSSPAPSEDLDGDKSMAAWEIDRLLEARLDDGTLVQDNKTYQVATLDFLVSGGDDFAWIMKQIPKSHIQDPGAGVMRDVLAEYIGNQKGSINSEDHPLVDLAQPRLTFVKLKAKSGVGHAKRRRYGKPQHR